MMTYFRIALVALWLVLLTNNVYAQNQKALDKIESAKIALITERLELTPQQAEKFWPIYNQYSAERKALRREYRSFRSKSEAKDLSEEDSKLILDQGRELKSRKLSIDEEYTEKLNDVITNKQLLQLRSAEEDFRSMLLQRLQQRSSKGDQRDSAQPGVGSKKSK